MVKIEAGSQQIEMMVDVVYFQNALLKQVIIADLNCAGAAPQTQVAWHYSGRRLTTRRLSLPHATNAKHNA